jgi:hypothetical protein
MGNAQTRSSNKYQQKTYDRIVTVVHKGIKERLQGYAVSRDKSLNALTVEALRQYITADNPDIARDIFGE